MGLKAGVFQLRDPSFISVKFLCKMPGGKKNTVYRRKRKGKRFTGVQRYAKKAKKTPHADREVTNSASSSSCDEGSVRCRNRPFAATSSRDVIFIKLWATTLRMPEMEKHIENTIIAKFEAPGIKE